MLSASKKFIPRLVLISNNNNKPNSFLRLTSVALASYSPPSSPSDETCKAFLNLVETSDSSPVASNPSTSDLHLEKRYLELAKQGFKLDTKGKKAIVIGAGPSGMCLSYELARAGMKVNVLEATQRIGGRADTLRTPFAEGLYAEAGAMRFPPAHYLVRWYIDAFKIPTQPFHNGQTPSPLALRYLYFPSLGNPKQNDTWKTVFPNSKNLWEKGRLASLLNKNEWWKWYGLEQNPEERWISDCKPIIEYLQQNNNNWSKVYEQLDQYSLLGWLQADRSSNPLFPKLAWSEKEISLYLLTSLQEMFVERGWIEAFKEYAGQFWNDNSQYSIVHSDIGVNLGAQKGLIEFTGGTDRFPWAFYKTISQRYSHLVDFSFGHRVDSITQDPLTGRMQVHSKDRADLHLADYVFVTVPFGALRHIRVKPELPTAKQQAIREIGYAPSTKILLQYKQRFWDLAADGSKLSPQGAASLTDRPSRNLYYPSHTYGREDDRSVLLASYTWGQEALSWGSLSEQERIEQTHALVKEVHADIPPEKLDELLETGASKVWTQDPTQGGAAFAYYYPKQWRSLQRAVIAPHGPLFFCGEHASGTHGWIQGALQSAYRGLAQLRRLQENNNNNNNNNINKK